MAKQLNILSAKEIRELYGLPKFRKQQRRIYFDLIFAEQELTNHYRTPLTRVWFILQLGYFKFKLQFFVFEPNQVKKDILYIEEKYFFDQGLDLESSISKPTRLAQQKMILQLFGYRIANESVREKLFSWACHLATLYCSPVFIFRELIKQLEQKQIVLPAYNTMQRFIIGKALTYERKRLEAIIQQYVKTAHRKQIDKLLSEKIAGYYQLRNVYEIST